MRTIIGAAIALAFVFLSICVPFGAAIAGPLMAAQAAQGTLTGKITDDRGNPLGGAKVDADGPGHGSATTAADGTFSLAVPPGLYTITVNKGGFGTAESDGVTILAGSPLRLAITLTESNLQSTRVIGRTSSSGSGNNRASFNISESATTSLVPGVIAERQNTNLTDLVAELPGVTVSRVFNVTPNTSFAVRGLPYQTRVTIDGHPISSAIAGQYNTNYALSSMFSDVEVTKGAGLNGAIAGESAVGTVNMRTRDFTPTNTYGLTVGQDNYNGGTYNAYADVNLLPGDRLSILVQKGFSGYNGPGDRYNGDRINTSNLSAIPIGTNSIPSFSGLDQWTGDFSSRYNLDGELAKVRYKFSESTSLTGEFLGLQGQYYAQGGAYGSYYGKMTLQACETGTTFFTDPGQCSSASTFSAPYTFGNAGNVVDGYSWFPGSYIQNNEPQFSAELRTSFKGDTILFRPYTHVINRYISGVLQNEYAGAGGGWYAVTNIANCQVQFLKPGSAGGPATGAAGPCFSASLTPTSPAYIGSATQTPVFSTTTTAPNGGTCSPTPPFTCFTTLTAVQNDGRYGYGTPFSQPEVDRLSGYTFNYIHPIGDGENSLNFSYDYRLDATSAASSDQSGAAAGCTYTIGTVTGAAAATFQPGCSTAQNNATYAAFNVLPRSSIGTPLTIASYSDFSLTGLFQLTPRLRLAVGNYYEIYRVQPQSENPATLATYAALGNASAAPVDLVTNKTSFSHYDPHVGFEYRPDPSLSIRASAGSSITQPYASILSGFGSITIPNGGNNQVYTVSIPNSQLKPESTVAYDVGFDKRLVEGTVISGDLYDITTHNVFISQTQTIAPPAPYTAYPGVQTNYVNGPEQVSYGVELSALRNPAIGFGYYVTGSLNRSYYAQVPLSFYAFNTTALNSSYIINNAQIYGNPFSKGYASVFFNGNRGFNVNLGAEYNGPNNPLNSIPYVLWDTSMRVPVVGTRVSLQMSVQNLTNYNNNVNIARGLVNQGYTEPAVYLSNGQLVYAGANTHTQQAIFAPPPRTFRLSGMFRL